MEICESKGPEGFFCTLENHLKDEIHAGDVHVAMGASGIVYEVWQEKDGAKKSFYSLAKEEKF